MSKYTSKKATKKSSAPKHRRTFTPEDTKLLAELIQKYYPSGTISFKALTPYFKGASPSALENHYHSNLDPNVDHKYVRMAAVLYDSIVSPKKRNRLLKCFIASIELKKK